MFKDFQNKCLPLLASMFLVSACDSGNAGFIETTLQESHLRVSNVLGQSEIDNGLTVDWIWETREYDEIDLEIALGILDELRNGIISLCKYDFDQGKDQHQLLGLIHNIDPVKLVLQNYLGSYIDTAQTVRTYKNNLELMYDVAKEQGYKIEFLDDLRLEIGRLNELLLVFQTDSDYFTMYPELNVLLNLNLVIFEAINNPFLLLSSNFVPQYRNVTNGYIDEFLMLRRERLVKELSNLNLVFDSQELEWSNDVNDILLSVYKDVDWSHFQDKLISGSNTTSDMNFNTFINSDLADNLRVVLRDFLKLGYRIAPQITMSSGYNSPETLAPFSMYKIQFLISNGPYTETVSPVNESDFYHPLFHGRKKYNNLGYLDAIKDGVLSESFILEEIDNWDGDLHKLPEFPHLLGSRFFFLDDLKSLINQKKRNEDPESRPYLITAATTFQMIYSNSEVFADISSREKLLEDCKQVEDCTDYHVYQAMDIYNVLKTDKKFAPLMDIIHKGYKRKRRAFGGFSNLDYVFYDAFEAIINTEMSQLHIEEEDNDVYEDWDESKN